MTERSQLLRRRNDYIRNKRFDLVERLNGIILAELREYYKLELSDRFESELLEFLDQQLSLRL